MAKKAEETVVITANHVTEVSKNLLDRFTEEEKDQLMTMLIEKEALKKLQEYEKRGKYLETSVEDFTQQIEKRILNKIIYNEAKVKVMAKR